MFRRFLYCSQTDTSLALEVKSMKKWEFYSPDQASSCINSWFSGKESESESLKKNLMMLADLDLRQRNAYLSLVLLQKPSPGEVLSDDDFLDSQESLTETDDQDEVLSVDDFFDSQESLAETDDQDKVLSDDNFLDSQESLTEAVDQEDPQNDELCNFSPISVLKDREPKEESDIAPCQYFDKLILFRFDDCLLPIKLKEIIMSDLRLLTLLEAGLPSWVIFFQSYPLFCDFYLPWMRHSARALYVLISLVTVVIGFYDLYKNVPLLKVTVARLTGPLFCWIEGWDMVTRIRYIGTMLFIQNLEKGLKWFLMMSRSVQTLLSAIARPLCGPFYGIIEVISPLWNACIEACEMLSCTVWFKFASVYIAAVNFIEFVLSPFELLCSYLWSIGESLNLN